MLTLGELQHTYVKVYFDATKAYLTNMVTFLLNYIILLKLVGFRKSEIALVPYIFFVGELYIAQKAKLKMIIY